MGLEDLKAIASHANVIVTALCDVDSNALNTANEIFPKAQIFKDYREMFNQISDQIDAVIISTPDHTHAPASLLAMEKNKSVYCQKPLTHFVYESREMRKVANEKKIVTHDFNQIVSKKCINSRLKHRGCQVNAMISLIYLSITSNPVDCISSQKLG